MKFKFESILEMAYKNFWTPTTDESIATKSAAKVTKAWQEKVMQLHDGLYQNEVPVLKLNEKIDLVNWTERIAYELKVSGKNPAHEFYKDIFKVLVFNGNSSPKKIVTLVFITEKSGVERLHKGLAKEVVRWASDSGLLVELVGV